MSNEASLYELMGKEQGIRTLVDHFYDEMSTLPEARDVLEMHPKDLTTSRDKLFMFFVGWSGGPQLYIEKFGHPRLRARHLPFKIGKSERDQWLFCFQKALLKMNYPKDVSQELFKSIVRVADHMRNQQE
jgi:hemoglobin